MNNGKNSPGSIDEKHSFKFLRRFDIVTPRKINSFLSREERDPEKLIKSLTKKKPESQEEKPTIYFRGELRNCFPSISELPHELIVSKFGIDPSLRVSYEEIYKFLKSEEDLFLGAIGLFLILDRFLNSKEGDDESPILDGGFYNLSLLKEGEEWTDSYGMISAPYVWKHTHNNVIDLNIISGNTSPFLGSLTNVFSFKPK